MVDLRRMRYLINRLPMAQFRRDKAMAKATKITSVLTGMPRGGHGAGSQVEEGVILLELASRALEEIETELKTMREELGPVIEQMDPPLQKRAMWMRYMEGRSVREIAYALNYSEQHIFRVLDRAELKIR